MGKIEIFGFFILLCVISMNPVQPQSSTQAPCASADVNGTLEVGCWGYKKCSNGMVLEFKCAAGKVFDKETWKCIVPVSGHTACSLENKCAGRPDGMYADQTDACQTYIRCLGEAVVGQVYCPASTVFNEEIQSCDFKVNVASPCGTKVIVLG
ncbi:unnamed protein product [Lymnaea stagnalis]|uniref:Chitin-binding type-2 domain-containing protein n=1 Tax=Lymnaea stagnalis TaxID=6523 RepID=A0AAV2HWJ3_LYMST